MKTSLVLLTVIFLVSACASQPSYRAANGKGYGYTETKIAANHYRVHTKVRGEQQGKAMDYALLRAAELTLLNGYDWFVVVDREKAVDREHTLHATTGTRYVVRKDCGLLACTSSAQAVPTTTFSTEPTRTSSEATLEIRFGKGIRPASNGENGNYDAMEITANIKP